MPTISDLPKRRALPKYKRQYNTAADYLKKQRLKLMEKFVPEHRLYLRASQFDGRLFSSPPPDVVRIQFTDSELQKIKQRSKPDPESASRQLRKSQLVQMWNADYEKEEQWKEYDEAKTTMEEKKHHSGLPPELFDNDRVIGEKRKRVVWPRYQIPPPRKKLVIQSSDSESDEEEEELDEGEIDEDVRPSIKEYQYDIEATCRTLQALAGDDHDDKDKEQEGSDENEAAGPLLPSPLPSSSSASLDESAV